MAHQLDLLVCAGAGMHNKADGNDQEEWTERRYIEKTLQKKPSTVMNRAGKQIFKE